MKRMESQDAWVRFVDSVRVPDDMDLGRSAMLIAASEYRGLDVEEQLKSLDSLAEGAHKSIGEEQDPLFCMNSLSEFIFDNIGFRGNQEDYYDPRNSLLNDVISRRQGIPITLSLLYIEVGKRLNIPLRGIGMPGHFLVKHEDVDDHFVDPFNNGILLSDDECSQRWRQATQTGVAWDSRYLTAVSDIEFLGRILRNLKQIYIRKQDHQRSLRTINWLLSLNPAASNERRDRGMVYYRMGKFERALNDLQEYLDSSPSSPDTEAVEKLVERALKLIGE